MDKKTAHKQYAFRLLEKYCSSINDGIKKSIFLPPQTRGSLAQLVQSICLTSRGSAVRIRQLPQRKSSTYGKVGAFFVEGILMFLQGFAPFV